MVLIENKLELFHRVVYSSRLKKYEREFSEWEKEKKNLEENRKKDLEEETKRIVDRRKKLAKTLSNEELKKAQEERRILQLKKMGEFEDDLILEVRKRVIEFTKTDEYVDKLFKGIKVTLSHLEPGSYIIGLTKNDGDKYFNRVQELAKDYSINLDLRVEPDEIIGGHTLSDGNKYTLNKDLQNIIEDKRYEIGKLLYDNLRGER